MNKPTDNLDINRSIQELNSLFLKNAFNLVIEPTEDQQGASARSVCNSPAFCAMLQLQQAGSMKIAGAVLKSSIWDDSIPFSLQVPLQHYMRCLKYLLEDGFDCIDYFCRAMVFDREKAVYALFVESLSDPSAGFILLSPEDTKRPVCPSPGSYSDIVAIYPVSSIAKALSGRIPAKQQPYTIFPEAAASRQAPPFTLAFCAAAPIGSTYDTLDILFLYGRENEVYESIQWGTRPAALYVHYIQGNEVLKEIYALSNDAATAGYLDNAFNSVQNALEQLSSTEEEMDVYSLVIDFIRNAPKNIFLSYILNSLLQAADIWECSMDPDIYKESVRRQIDACRDMADVWNKLQPYIKNPAMISRQESFHTTPYYMSYYIAPVNGLLPFMLHYLHHMLSFAKKIGKCDICSTPIFSMGTSISLCRSCSIQSADENDEDKLIKLTPSQILLRKKNNYISKYIHSYRQYVKIMLTEIGNSGEKVAEKSAYAHDLEKYIAECQKQVVDLKKTYITNKNMIPCELLQEYSQKMDDIAKQLREHYVACKEIILSL